MERGPSQSEWLFTQEDPEKGFPEPNGAEEWVDPWDLENMLDEGSLKELRRAEEALRLLRGSERKGPQQAPGAPGKPKREGVA